MSMFRPSSALLLRSARLSSAAARPASAKLPRLGPQLVRAVSNTPKRGNDSAAGNYARTDPTIRVQHPEEEDLPSSKPVRRFKRTLGSFSLEGKTAVVTGGARGLGYVMTQALVESGADVAILDLNGDAAAESAERLINHFREENPDVEHLPVITSHSTDVASPVGVHQTFEEILEQHRKIDILVTSAGFTENFKAEEYPTDRLQKLWDVNVNGTYLCAAEVARHMIKRGGGGSMVLISSMSGVIVNVPQPQAPYNASKAAVRHLGASLAVEWAVHNIRVNSISPGYMLTALTEKILDDKPDLKSKWTSLIPTGKMGRPEDLMGAVVYLASDASGYVTGSDLRVDGGYTCT